MPKKQKITPCLWFDGNAEEAANFYVSIFPDSRIDKVTRAPADYPAGKTGDVLIVAFTLAGQAFTALNGGSHHNFTPAVSFFVNAADAAEVDALYERLVPDGSVLVPLQAYPFSKRYAWVQDRFGLSWQINAAPRAQKIVPCLLFVGDHCGRAEDAMTFYASLFPNSEIEDVSRYGADETPDREGTVKHAIFSLAGQEFRAMDSALDHAFTFNEAISFQIDCQDQTEVDRLADTLSAVPGAEQCGWVKDSFGLSWQIVPGRFMELIGDEFDPARAKRAMEAMMTMKRLDIAALERACGCSS